MMNGTGQGTERDEYGNEVDANGRLIDLAPHGPSDLYDENGERTPAVNPEDPKK